MRMHTKPKQYFMLKYPHFVTTVQSTCQCVFTKSIVRISNIILYNNTIYLFIVELVHRMRVSDELILIQIYTKNSDARVARRNRYRAKIKTFIFQGNTQNFGVHCLLFNHSLFVQYFVCVNSCTQHNYTWIGCLKF